MLAEYGMSFEDLMNLSLKRFWFLVNQIDRIRARRDLRRIQLLASATSAETYKNALDYLQDQVGRIYVWTPKVDKEIAIDPDTGLDPEFDREGLRRLKAKLAAQKHK